MSRWPHLSKSQILVLCMNGITEPMVLYTTGNTLFEREAMLITIWEVLCGTRGAGLSGQLC